MSLSHWDWRVSGCRLEGLQSRNCLAGLRDVCAPMGVSAGLLEEVSCETIVLQTLTCKFLRKSRTKRSFWGLARVSRKSVPQCPARVSHKSVPQEFPTRVTHKSVPQECPTRLSHKSDPQPLRVSHKSVPQQCPTRVSYKSVPQELPTRVSHKSVPQECPTRVSSYRSIPQECPTRGLRDVCAL